MIGNFFRRTKSTVAFEAKAAPPSTASPLIALSLNGAPRWSGRDFVTMARFAVMSNAVVYRCVRMIAEAAAAVPWTLYEGDVEIETHPFLALLQRPNPQEDGTELFTRWYAYLQSAGNAFLQAVGAGGPPRELYVLRPDRVSIVPDNKGWPIAYDYKCGAGRSMRLTRDPASGFMPVMQGKLFHPLDDHYGLSPMEAAGAAIDVHNAGVAWTKSLLDNSARPSGALVYKGPEGSPSLTEDQFQRLKSELETAYQGAANAGRPMVLEGGLEWRSMSYSPTDMNFSDIRNAAAREIALAFGIPTMLLGIPGDNTYANYQEANLNFWRQTVLPLVARTARALTAWLGPNFGASLRVAYDADQVDALVKERESVWARIGEANFLTLNEKRAAAGYSPIAGGDALA
jgi:HK97 family phage portal protein